MRNTGSAEFVEWMVYIQMREEEKFLATEKADYHFASVAVEIRRILEALCEVPKNKRASLEDLLVKFNKKGDDKPQAAEGPPAPEPQEGGNWGRLTKEDVARYNTMIAKAQWAERLGIKEA
jgi:hypothetical protein